MAVDPTGGLRDGYELKLNSYDLGVDIELLRRRAAAALRAPRGAAPWSSRAALDKVFCAGANIQMLAGSTPRPQGQLLQVHERDPQRASRTPPPHSGQVWIAARQRHGRRRRLRAGAGLRRDRAGRRPRVGGVAARGAAARRAARHRRPHPAGRQAPRAPRPRRRVRHPDRGRQGPAGGRVGAGRRASPRQRLRRGRRERPQPGRRRRDRPDRRRGVALRRSSPIDGDERPLRHVDVAIDRERSARPRSRSRGPAEPQPSTPDELQAAGADAWLLARRPRARRRDPRTFASTSPRSARGCCAPPATPTLVRRRRGRARARTRDHWLVREVRLYWARTLEAPRPVGPHARRPRRAGQLLRRHAGRAGRSPPTAPSCSTARSRTTTIRRGRHVAPDRRQRRLVPDVQRPVPAGDAVLGARRRAATRPRRRRQGPARAPTPPRPGWSRSRPTTSTGTTRSA